MATKRRHEWIVLVAVQVVAAALMIFAVDRLARSTLDHLQIRRLNARAESGSGDLENRVAALKQQVENLKVELAHRASRHIPSPDELRTLAAAQHVSIRRLERINRGRATSNKEMYSISLTGRPIDLVIFLHAVWEQFSFNYEHVGIQRSDEFGEIATLMLACSVATP